MNEEDQAATSLCTGKNGSNDMPEIRLLTQVMHLSRYNVLKPRNANRGCTPA